MRKVHVTGTDLAAGKTAELQWGTVPGGWVVEDYYHFKGKKCAETMSPLGKFSIDSSQHSHDAVDCDGSLARAVGDAPADCA